MLRLSGEGLARTQRVVFLGGRGSRDDRVSHPDEASPHRVIVQVPKSARSGRLRVVASAASATGPRLRVLKNAAGSRPATSPTATPANGGVFPVQERHDFGTEVNRFGGGRNYQGQDVFATCGTPLVAALAGEVTLTRFHERAGNCVVIRGGRGD